MMLIMMLLQTMKVTSMILWSVNVMQGVMANVVSAVAEQKTSPEAGCMKRVLKGNDLAHCEVTQYCGDQLKYWWVNQTISK